MSETPRPPDGPKPDASLDLERYLDGQMSQAEAEAFAARFASDPALRAQAEMQAQMDAALQRAAGPPGDCTAKLDALLAALPAQAKPTQTDPDPPATHRPVWLKAAAVVALLVLGGIAVYTFTRPDPGQQTVERDPVHVDVVAMYRAQQGYGFRPDWVCDRERFRTTCAGRLGIALTLAQTPGDRAMLGMTAIRRGDGRALMMLGRAHGEDVIVYIDHADQGEHYGLEAGDGLHVYPTTVGRLRLVEVSPLEAPVFLEYLSIPDGPGTRPQ